MKLRGRLGATLLAVSLFVFPANLDAQTKASPQRPKILGIAHVGYFVSDFQRAETFYGQLLGFEPWFSDSRHDTGQGSRIFKINDDQYVQLAASSPTGDGHLGAVAFQTDNADQMRQYLAAHGVKVPDKVSRDALRNLTFAVTDPDGHRIEFVQFEPDGWTARSRGKYMRWHPISQHMLHTGFTVGSVSAAMKFYADLLGFHEFWRGSANGTELSWINMRVPDGDDYVEFMLYRELPPPDKRGTQNHICLIVPDIDKAAEQLKQRAAAAGYTRPIEIRTGRNRRRQANLYDPDGTRVELMEPNTIDGQPAPPSTAPPPHP